MIEASANIGVQRSVCALLVVLSVVFYRVGRPPFYRHKEGRCTCTRDRGSRRLLPESWGCSDRVLWEVHCGVWRWSWQSSWASSLTPSHRTNGPGPASRSGTGPVSPRVPEVVMLSTCDRGPGPPQVGLGPPRAYPDRRELSAQLAAREGSGAATCHAGAGASLPLEAPSPTRIQCGWLRRALPPRHAVQLLSVHTVDRQLPRRLSSVTEARSSVSAPRAWATSHDDQLLTGATVHAATVD